MFLLITIFINSIIFAQSVSNKSVRLYDNDKIELGKVYVDHDICPGEGCTYGKWTVKEGRVASIYAKNSTLTPEVASVFGGEVVESITGETHNLPYRVLLLDNFESWQGKTYQPGDTIFVLTYLGEGYYKIWHKGEFSVTGLYSLPNTPNYKVLDKQYHQFKPVWWVKMKTKDNKVGWTRDTDLFSDKNRFE